MLIYWLVFDFNSKSDAPFQATAALFRRCRWITPFLTYPFRNPLKTDVNLLIQLNNWTKISEKIENFTTFALKHLTFQCCRSLIHTNLRLQNTFLHQLRDDAATNLLFSCFRYKQRNIKRLLFALFVSSA